MHGHGCEASQPDAKRWFEAAAARGHGDAARVMHLMALKDAL